MAEMLGTASGGHPNLNLTAEEKRAYKQLFTEADPDGFGAVSGDVAVKFFEKTKLSPEVLGQIWQLADSENRGFLTPSGFGVVLRLIGHAQAGRAPTPQLATQPAPLPRFDALPSATVSQQNTGVSVSQQNTGVPASPVQAVPPGPPPIRVPALTPEKVNEYSSLFEKSGAENGYLSGVVAKQIFERARLPNEVLGKIWNLSDTQGRGSLDSTEFVIAMHLLASYKAGAMRGVPNTLPPGLYEAASRRRPASYSRPSAGGPPPAGIPQQFTGFHNQRPQSPLARQQVSTPLSAQSTGDGWLVTPADKARFDQIFANLDKQGRGFITGDQAVEFFGNARLPEEVLAQIWDLADINSEGHLSRDEFAVAMYLIRQQRGTKDGRGNLPQSLPPALVPPPMRRQQVPPSQPTAPAFDNAPITQPRSAADDLFGLDAFASSAAAPAQVAQSTGGTDAGPFANPRSPPPGSAAAAPSPSTTFKPFVPNSSFGRSIIPQSTGSPAPQQASNVQQPQSDDDLLGDVHPDVSSRLTNETSELANLSNQVGNLSRQMTDVQASRGQTEQEIGRSSQQKRDFEARLGQLRAQYQQEVKGVEALKTQLTTIRNDTKHLQQDHAMIEGTHQDLRAQHEQLNTQLQADQSENATLKDKIRQMNGEIEQLKPQLEKLRSDARQQKGLVAINRKQLSTNEAERDKIKADMEAARQEHEEALREHEETARRLDASLQELEEARGSFANSATAFRSPPPVASPAPSTSSNPFFRRTTDAVYSPPIASPAIAEEQRPSNSHSAFDSIFGPVHAGSSSPAPPTSFNTDLTSQDRAVSGQLDSSQDGSVDSSGPLSGVGEPPAPPKSRQITSASLPFRAPLERAESVSSSVKVAPPASRLSPSDTPRATTPSTSTPSHGEQETSQGPIDSTTPTNVDESPYQTGSTYFSQHRSNPTELEKVSSVPGAFPAETPQVEDPGVPPAAIALGAGAATLAAGVGIATAATNQEDKGKEPEGRPAVPSKEGQSDFDDFFGGPAHQRSRSEQVADFDSAFASMGRGPATNGSSDANQEFPDIQELADEESSDYSDETPVGFEDDFTANSKGPEVPPKVPEEATTAKSNETKVASAVPEHLIAPRPPFQTVSSNASSLPGVESQVSPPAYGDSVSNDDPNHFPMEYKGLLPAREDPTSPPPAGGETSQGPAPMGEPPSYGPEVPKSRSASESQSAAAPAHKSNSFDFDSAFAGMGPARAEDDEDEDEEEHFTSPRNYASEFNPTFGTPTQSRSTTTASVPAPSMSVYSSVTSAPSPANNPKFAFDSFDDTFSATQAPSTQSQTSATDGSHNWDAMFANIDAPPSHTINDLRQESEPRPQTDMSTSGETSTAAPSQPRSTQQPSLLAQSSNILQKPQRPQPGRAVSAGTEHDDPILKRLTAMGWSRDESLRALEQFDYNIDKAADYLTFK